MSAPHTYIVGCGGHGRVLLDVLRSTAESTEKIRFVDDRDALWGTQIDGCPVSGGTGSIPRGAQVFVGIGDNIARHNLSVRLAKKDCVFPPLVSPFAVVSARARIADGAVVFHRAVIQTGAAVERGAVVNTGAIVEHDCTVGAFAQLAPGAALSGGVRVGEGTLLGTGSSVNKCVTIGAWCLVAPGIAVLADMPDGVVYKPGIESIRVERNYRVDEINAHDHVTS